MRDINKVCIIGRVCQVPEIRFTSEGKGYGKFSIAVNRDEKSIFISCQAFGETMKAIAEYVVKGQRVCVTGRLETWKNEETGNTNTYIVCEDVQFLARPADKKEVSEPEEPVKKPVKKGKK